MRFLFGLGALVLAASVAPAAEPSALTLENFAKVHALIKPDTGIEKWQQIAWQASLWDARKQAAREGKPILLWEMDGHPLGCV